MNADEANRRLHNWDMMNPAPQVETDHEMIECHGATCAEHQKIKDHGKARRAFMGALHDEGII